MKIFVDWGRCDRNGVCAAEAPEILELDENDQLIVLKEEFGQELADSAEAAVRVCPKRALRIDR
ncbi:MAG: ferredoxin [Pseudomonadota bacterium]|nr:ferredoxin [Pseudomonadota bacterium]